MNNWCDIVQWILILMLLWNAMKQEAFNQELMEGLKRFARGPFL